MQYPSITHHGAHEGVTGSCHQLHVDQSLSLLIDCGLFQGAEARAKATAAIDFSLEGVAALVVTHVHQDHVGRIPWLLAAGFEGPILCSEPSAKLLPLMLEDAFKLMFNQDRTKRERYLRLVGSRVIALPYEQWFPIGPRDRAACQLRLQRAGHVLGSAYVEVSVPQPGQVRDKRIVFSGDLGNGRSAVLRGPEAPERADTLVLESTYGDRLHGSGEDRQARLEQLIDTALADQGTILIPSFSLGRTQELLADLESLLRRKAIATPVGTEPVDWPQLPVILDSPLASRITQAYRDLQPYWNAQAQARVERGQSPLGFPQLITIDSHEQHLRTVNYLASTLRPAIVIAGNGMCSAGRILNYLKAMLRHPRHNVLFSGYQAKGTAGALIQATEGAEGFVAIDLDGERYDIRAGVATLEGYSAHADQAGLLAFVEGMRERPTEIRLVHGGKEAKVALACRLRNRFRAEISVITDY